MLIEDLFMEAYWENRFEEAREAFGKLKSLTKRHPAFEWTPEYRELADAIHSLGRDVFYVEPSISGRSSASLADDAGSIPADSTKCSCGHSRLSHTGTGGCSIPYCDCLG
jgi:hypothetical protein